MLKNSLIDIAMLLKYNTNSTSQALLITLELAVIKKYKIDFLEQLKITTQDLKKLEQLYNLAFHEFSFKHNITSYCNDATLLRITKLLIHSSIEAQYITDFIQEFTIEKSKNELYGFSTPVELKRLMVSLLEIKSKESIYNPCFGIGGFFEDIAQVNKNISLYGEDIEETNRLIAGLTAQLAGLRNCSLYKKDVLDDSSFCTENKCKQFDKIICNPPLDLVFKPSRLQNDIRFNKYGIPPANASELAFLEHSLACMKTKAIVLVRLSVLQRTSNEAKIRTAIAYDEKIETVIALPKGIIPQWTEDMALLILSHGNKDILFVDLNKPYFSKKKGRRNTIYRVDDILELINKRKNTEHSYLVKIDKVKAINLSPEYYINRPSKSKGMRSLNEIVTAIYRAQRVTSTESSSSKYFELGIHDIIENGYTTTSKIVKSGKVARVKLFALKQFDILLPLRGKPTHIGIIGKTATTLVPNAGIIVIRLKNVDNAPALYLYLKSSSGNKFLQNLYDESSNHAINPDILNTLQIPEKFNSDSNKIFHQLFILQDKINTIQIGITELLN